MAKTAVCPLCGQPATVTLFEQIDLAHGTEGQSIEFRCTDPRHHLSEADVLSLWAADRTVDASSG